MYKAMAVATFAVLATTSLCHADLLNKGNSGGLASPFKPEVPGTSEAIGGMRGVMTINYHGPLADGTICTPAPNGISFSMGTTSIHYLGLTEETRAEFGALFATGSFCSITFDGWSVLNIHHGTSITIAPDRIVNRAPYIDGLLSITTLSGAYEMRLDQPTCRVAPCPSNGYTLKQDGQVIARAEAIAFEDLSQQPATTTVYADQRLPFDWAFGTIRLPGVLSVGGEPPNFPAFSVTSNNFGTGQR